MKSPFKFLDAYELKDRAVFFGREEEIETLYDLVFETPLLLIHGLSGTGKTSLIQCGLASRFTGPDWLPFYIRRGNNIDLSLRQTLSAALPEEEPSSAELSTNIRRLYSLFLRPVYLIFDQFEELFILGSPEEQQNFARSIRDILLAELPCKIVLVMREEFMGQLYEIEKEIPSIYDFRLRVEYMGYKKVHEVIEKSLSYFKISLAQPTAALNLLYKYISEGKTGIQLPYLQVYLDMLWREDFVRTYPSSTEQNHWQVQIAAKPPIYPPLEFTEAEIDALGSMENVFARFLHEQERDLQKKLQTRFTEPQATQAIRSILDVFVTTQGTKQPQHYQRDASQIQLLDTGLDQVSLPVTTDTLSYVLEGLIQARLLRDNGYTLELAHDSLATLIDQERSDEQRRTNGLLLRLKNAYYEFEQSKGKTWPSQKLLLESAEILNKTKVEPVLLDFHRNSQKEQVQSFKRKLRNTLILGVFSGAFVLVVAFLIFRYEKNRKVNHFISQALIQQKIDPTPSFYNIRKALAIIPGSAPALAISHGIYSDNEFYFRSFEHSSEIKGLAFDPGKIPQYIYTWSEQKIYRWHWKSQLQDTLLVKYLVVDCQLSPNGRWLAYSDAEGYLNVVDAIKMKLLSRLKMAKQLLSKLTFDHSSEFLYAVETLPDPENVKNRKKPLHNFYIHKISIAQGFKSIHSINISDTSEISSIAQNPVTLEIWLGFSGGRTEIHDAAFKYLRTAQRHYDQVLAFAFSPKGEAVSVDRNGLMYFWERNVGLQAHSSRINQVIWSSDGSRIFTASKDYTVKSWSPLGELYATYRGHKAMVLGLCVTANGEYFASADRDGWMRLWKTESKVVKKFGPHQNGAAAILLTADGKTIITGSDQGENEIGEQLNDPNANIELLLSRLFAPQPRAISIWDGTNTRKIRDLIVHAGGITALCKNKQIWASSSTDGRVYLWDKPRATQAFDSLKHPSNVTHMAFSNDGKQLMLGGDSCTLWNLQTRQKKAIPQSSSVAGIVPFGADKWILGIDNELKVYDQAGNYLYTLSVKNLRPIKSLTISPNGQYLLVGEWDAFAKLLDSKGALLAEIELSGENKTGARATNAVAFAPDNRTFCASGEGGIAVVYRLLNGAAIPIRTLQHYPKKSILSLQFSADGKYLYTGSGDGWVRKWNILY